MERERERQREKDSEVDFFESRTLLFLLLLPLLQHLHLDYCVALSRSKKIECITTYVRSFLLNLTKIPLVGAPKETLE